MAIRKRLKSQRLSHPSKVVLTIGVPPKIDFCPDFGTFSILLFVKRDENQLYQQVFSAGLFLSFR